MVELLNELYNFQLHVDGLDGHQDFHENIVAQPCATLVRERTGNRRSRLDDGSMQGTGLRR